MINLKKLLNIFFMILFVITTAQASLRKKLKPRNEYVKSRQNNPNLNNFPQNMIYRGSLFTNVTKKCESIVYKKSSIGKHGRPTHKDIFKFIKKELSNKKSMYTMISFREVRYLLKKLISKFITKIKSNKKFKKNLNEMEQLGRMLSDKNIKHINAVLEKEFGDFILNKIKEQK